MNNLAIHTVKKAHFLKKQEQLCFNVLSHAIDQNLYILPKVRIGDMFETSDQKNEFWTTFDKVASKYVDFLICTKTDFQPLVVIWIKGETYHEEISKDEETFIQQVFDHSKVPVIEVSLTELNEYKTDFEEYAFHSRIREALGLE